jgi:cytidine deaminase
MTWRPSWRGPGPSPTTPATEPPGQSTPRLAGIIGITVDDGHVIPASAVAGLMRDAGLPTVEALMLAMLPQAQALARPAISNFRVGAVGREYESGALILGANVEFCAAPPSDTIHAEQFLFSRAHHRGVSLDLVAVSARPCGHCRQFMAEFAGRERLTILDPAGDRLTLAELLPWSFTPADLGEAGITPAPGRPLKVRDDGAFPSALRAALKAAGARAYAPYSRSPSAVVLQLDDGAILSGAAIENAAYNPGLPPLQAALVNLIAAGRDYGAMKWAVLGSTPGGAVDHTSSTRRLLGSLAPEARFDVVNWVALPST